MEALLKHAHLTDQLSQLIYNKDLQEQTASSS